MTYWMHILDIILKLLHISVWATHPDYKGYQRTTIKSLKDIYFVIYGIISDFTDKGQFQYVTNLRGLKRGLTCIQHKIFH